jgi:opacity protein-like surface antigen
MMANRQILLPFIAFALFFSNNAFSQEQEETFKPSGKVYGKVFSNFHYQLFTDEQESAFAVDRAYFGYGHHLSKEFTVNLKLDIASPNQNSQDDILKRYAYFKNAALIYTKKNLQISFGLIDLFQFKVQEKFWGHRYIYKSFQDKHKFGSSADLGASLSYKLNDYISADLTVMNGEGYNQLQSDNAYKTGLGITITPIKNLTARLYADYIEREEIQTTWVAFLGYKFKKLAKIGVEYNYQANNKYIKDQNLYGLSSYVSVNISEKWELFGRYDKLWSNKAFGDVTYWNINKDGSAIIAGIQFALHKNIKIAANYQDWYPYAENLDNESFFYLNLEYKF